jgi:hypothetical protein
LSSLRKDLFQVITQLKNTLINLMETTARKQLCGDTLNIFGNFQWSKAYSYYSSLTAQKDIIWASKIARVGCVPEVIDCK